MPVRCCCPGSARPMGELGATCPPRSAANRAALFPDETATQTVTDIPESEYDPDLKSRSRSSGTGTSIRGSRLTYTDWDFETPPWVSRELYAASRRRGIHPGVILAEIVDLAADQLRQDRELAEMWSAEQNI